MVVHRVRRGEHAAVWSVGGDVKIVHGPKIVTTVTGRFQRLPVYRAAENQYLEIRFADGHIENVPGPVRFEYHPLEHVDVQVRQGFSLTSHEALIVYRKEQKNETLGTLGGDQVKRLVIYGPTMHIPESGEWIHEFSWHGVTDGNKCALTPNARKFTKLPLIADQFYYNVRDVRTADEALLEIKVMIFYELENLELMLDSTHDPIGDFVNACCADVVAFVSQRTYENFVEQTSLLNSLDTYSQLTARASKIGYNVSKVVYRGYHACANLQEMHNHSIEARTKLRLNAEEERQIQELADLKLQKENARTVQQTETDRAIKRDNHALQLELAAEAAQAQMVSKQKEAELEMELARKAHDQEMQFLQQRNTLNVQLWSQMKDVGVDLTTYLTAQYERPAKILRIDGSNSANTTLVNQINT